MNKMKIIIKNELLRYFISPLAYVYLISFLLLNGSFAIYFGNFFARGQASLEPMFAYHPWLYLLFIPGISMRLWAEEFRSRTINQIMTMPVSLFSLVLGKYFAALIFAGLALLLTFPFWITVNVLGSPDNAVIAISYFSSFILAACMLAVSQTMSALTKNQVIALVLAVIVNLLFFLSGLEYVLSLFRVFSPDYIIDMIASFSFLTHFESLTKGLLELRDIIFFASLICLFNFITLIIVSIKTSGSSRFLKSGNYGLICILLVTAFIGINLLANNLTRRFQIDFTNEKIFTLTDTSKKILENLPEPVTAKFYYSKVLEERNPDIRIMADKIRMFLEQLKKTSNGKFNYIIYNPNPLDSIEDRAYTAGLQPIPVIDMGQNAFFGMQLIDEKDDKQTIPFFSKERENFLEQDIVEKIYLLNHTKKTLGIITSLPIYDINVSTSFSTQKWEIIKELEQFYNIKKITKAEDMEGINVLAIIHPQGMSDELIKAVKVYSLKGGNSLILLDAAAEAPRIYMPMTLKFLPSNIGDLDKFFGFSFHNEIVVGDLDNSILVDATKDYQKNPMFIQDVVQFKLKGDNLNRIEPETKNLNQILFSSASIVRKIAKNIEFIPLFQPSKNSAVLPISVVYNQVHPAYVLSRFQADTQEKFIGAKIIDKTHKVIVVADTDFIYDTFWAKHFTILDSNYFVPMFDNANFVFNALESLSGGDNLIELRGKTIKERPFEIIENIRKNNQYKFKLKENSVFDEIEKSKLAMDEVWNKKNFEERQNFNSDELALITKLRSNLTNLRGLLAKLKLEQNREINNIKLMVKAANIYAIPTLIALVLLLSAIRNRRRVKHFKQKTNWNRDIFSISFLTLVLFCGGIGSTYLGGLEQSASFENEKVFAKLPEKINDITQINIKNHLGDLNFYKEKGIWKLKQQPDLPVYQERIKSFLGAMVEATYYEKKSANVELLGKFGLTPIESENSKNTRIELQDTNSKNIESFEIGRHDISIGRGAKGSYLKFDGQFQVWLVRIDFIDLSTNWQNWTYSHLWDLRFGRLLSYNNQKNEEKIINLAKILLNSSVIGVNNASYNKLVSTFELSIESEDKNITDISFYNVGDKYFVSYNVNISTKNEKLEQFDNAVKNKLYFISKEDFERIKNAL